LKIKKRFYFQGASWAEFAKEAQLAAPFFFFFFLLLPRAAHSGLLSGMWL
jgi:hypothetical protein